MSPLHDPLRDLRDGAVGFSVDGGVLDLPTATRIEITATRDDVASVSITRSFRCAGTASLRAILPIMSPRNAVMQRLIVRVEKPVAITTFQVLPYTPSACDEPAVLHHAEPGQGLHTVTVPALDPSDEVEVTAHLEVPLTIYGDETLLRLPMKIAHVLSVQETALSGRVELTAILLVSERVGNVWMERHVIGESPVMVPILDPIELRFPRNGEEIIQFSDPSLLTAEPARATQHLQNAKLNE